MVAEEDTDTEDVNWGQEEEHRGRTGRDLPSLGLTDKAMRLLRGRGSRWMARETH